MSHLSNWKVILVMFAYSALTFFITPLITRYFMGDQPDQCIAGFLVGFTISIILWMKFGRHLSEGGKYN
tara:strand:+ start:146 stop:352 length:207 start_codon:yes stop_codon:yes gene_type:complete